MSTRKRALFIDRDGTLVKEPPVDYQLDSFIKKITFQEISSDGIRALGSTIQTMAANEHLDAHRNAVTIRLNTI